MWPVAMVNSQSSTKDIPLICGRWLGSFTEEEDMLILRNTTFCIGYQQRNIGITVIDILSVFLTYNYGLRHAVL